MKVPFGFQGGCFLEGAVAERAQFRPPLHVVTIATPGQSVNNGYFVWGKDVHCRVAGTFKHTIHQSYNTSGVQWLHRFV